eukprot:8215356-Karenia_brevis.AAC.1
MLRQASGSSGKSGRAAVQDSSTAKVLRITRPKQDAWMPHDDEDVDLAPIDEPNFGDLDPQDNVNVGMLRNALADLRSDILGAAENNNKQLGRTINHSCAKKSWGLYLL